MGSGRMGRLFHFFFLTTIKKKISETPYDTKACFINVPASGSASNPVLGGSRATPHSVPRQGPTSLTHRTSGSDPPGFNPRPNRLLSSFFKLGKLQLVVARSVSCSKSPGPGG